MMILCGEVYKGSFDKLNQSKRIVASLVFSPMSKQRLFSDRKVINLGLHHFL